MAKKKQRKESKERKTCRLIQWERKKIPVDAKGNPICPECGEPAELILGFFGQPCWGHKQ